MAVAVAVAVAETETETVAVSVSVTIPRTLCPDCTSLLVLEGPRSSLRAPSGAEVGWARASSLREPSIASEDAGGSQ